MTGQHVLTWDVTASKGIETAWVDLGERTLSAHGRAVGTVPEAYWITYELATGEDYVTRRLRVRAESAAGSRELDLRRDDEGRWTAGGEPLAGLDEALDCDLGLCPLTNTMPLLRHGLHRAPGTHEFVMAWVSVPELAVQPSRQRYEHLARTEEGALVRYSSGTFQRDLECDGDGLIVGYPDLAQRTQTR
ncbi:putative glycolipid-binding domain-containing protein [Streptomyces olivaceiscleroticus]|uniref:Glycolipid-binding domain-containing protein n=1 Tax=Streptomyces olivaceiscleroticus TaxID=68245 RepID=A0ABN1AIU1_9ACTN